MSWLPVSRSVQDVSKYNICYMSFVSVVLW